MNTTEWNDLQADAPEAERLYRTDAPAIRGLLIAAAACAAFWALVVTALVVIL